MKSWLIHLWQWVLSFPIGDGMHLDVRGVSTEPGQSDPEYTCLICGHKRPVDDDEEDTTYYADLVHMTDAGYNIVAGIVVAAVQTL